MTRTEATPLLLDTQLLLWWAIEPRRLPGGTASLLADPAQPLVLSVVSLWEVAIKSSLGRADFQVEAAALRLGLLGPSGRAPGAGALVMAQPRSSAAVKLPPLPLSWGSRLQLARVGSISSNAWAWLPRWRH